MSIVDTETNDILYGVAKAAQRWLRARKEAIRKANAESLKPGTVSPWRELADAEAELAKMTADYELLAGRPK